MRVGNGNINKSLDDFEFGQDLTTDYGVSCPLASINRRLHFLSVAIDPIHVYVIRTCTISRTRSNFGQIRPQTTELSAIECIKKNSIYL